MQKSFLIGALAAEIKNRTGKANYALLAEFLEPYYKLDNNRLSIEVKRIREAGDLLHLIETGEHRTSRYTSSYKP